MSDADESKLDQLVKEHENKNYIVLYCMYGQLRSPAAALSIIRQQNKDATSNNVYVPILYGACDFGRVPTWTLPDPGTCLRMASRVGSTTSGASMTTTSRTLTRNVGIR